MDDRRTLGGAAIGVTGALGFVASHLFPRMLERGDRPVAIVRPSHDASGLERMGIEVRRADLLDAATFGSVFEGLDGLIHLSGMAQVPGFLPAVEKAGVRRGVFVGSMGVYTKLESSGADSKRRGEAALRASSVTAVIVRPTMIYGTPADRNLARLLQWLARVPVVPVPGGGSTLQQPVHVEDLSSAILAALDLSATSRGEYNAGGPEAMPLRELIQQAGAAMGRKAWVLPLPLMPAYHTVMLLRRLRLPCPVRGEQVLRLAESKAVDIGTAVTDLGYRPRSFKVGIEAEAVMLRGARGA